MTSRKQRIWRLPLATLLLACCLGVRADESRLQHLSILVPAERGGGWDLTARAMAEALQQTGSVESVDITYSPGAGGLIGLAQFISSSEGRGDTLMVGGMFMVGAVLPNRATISLLNTTPLARLTWDNAVIAVPTSSDIETADGLIEALVSTPDSVSWIGGSRGGGDEMILLDVAHMLGIAPSRLHYTALPGGGEVGAALISGKYTAGISGYSEFETLVEDGKLRILAVATKNGLADIAAPTFQELGIEVERLNWRGIFASPDINATQLAVLTNIVEHMVETVEWQQLLRKYHWQSAYLAGPEFVEFVRSEQSKAAADILAIQDVGSTDAEIISAVLFRRYVWALGLGVLSVLLVLAMYYQRNRASNREEGMQHALEAATGEANLRAEELEKALAGIRAQIDAEFDKWELSSAERDIALLMLKGLRLKEIANARGTSERTVRQQAQAVYKKAGVEGRSDLAAYFIEDFMQSMKREKIEVQPQS